MGRYGDEVGARDEIRKRNWGRDDDGESALGFRAERLGSNLRVLT